MAPVLALWKKDMVRGGALFLEGRSTQVDQGDARRLVGLQAQSTVKSSVTGVSGWLSGVGLVVGRRVSGVEVL